MGGSLVVGPGFKEEDAAGVPAVLCPGLDELFERLHVVVLKVAESISNTTVEKNGGAIFECLKHPLFVLKLAKENLALKFSRLGAQLVEGRVADQLGGCLRAGRMTALGKGIDDGCLP